MIIAVACDHAGFPLKDEVITAIEETGSQVIDLGTYNQEPLTIRIMQKRQDVPSFKNKPIGL
jgi:ribose 5-phosphate isomerase RpiB